MIVPDVNLLLYAHVDGFAQHEAARGWWESALSGTEDVGLAPVVVAGFLRLSTSRRVLTSPMAVDQAVGIIRSWLARPMVHALVSDARHLETTLELLTDVGVAGNLTTNAQIAAHALQDGATIATNDTDFARFSAVVVHNPLTASS